jgi:hypothetical protein
MLIIIGGTGYGKSTIAKKLANGRPIISAGEWIRILSNRRHHGVSDPCNCWRCRGEEQPPDLGTASIFWLKLNPQVSLEHIQAQMPADRNVVIEGIRNPGDLIALARPGDHVIDVGGEGTSDFERSGLRAVRECKDFLGHLGITWTTYARCFASLPEPIKASVPVDFLKRNNEAGVVSGKIVALECYSGEDVTAMWASDDGGTFHDIPLSELITKTHHLSNDSDFREYARANNIVEGSHSYNKSPKGRAIIEVTPIMGHIQVFSRNRVWIGTGRSLYMMHWPEDNLLLHVVEIEGRLLLWPPHKLMWGNCKVLPGDWKKNPFK